MVAASSQDLPDVLETVGQHLTHESVRFCDAWVRFGEHLLQFLKEGPIGLVVGRRQALGILMTMER